MVIYDEAGANPPAAVLGKAALSYMLLAGDRPVSPDALVRARDPEATRDAFTANGYATKIQKGKLRELAEAPLN